MQRIASLVLFSLALSALVGSAWAFLPGDGDINRDYGRQYGQLDAWQVEVTFPAFPGVAAEYWLNQGRWRQEWYAGDVLAAVAVGPSPEAVRPFGEESAPPPLLMAWQAPRPVAKWMRLGATNATRSYSFDGDEPVLVFGAGPGDATSPQAWLSNDGMHILRLVLTGPRGPVTFRFSTYSLFSGYQVPHSGVIEAGDGERLEFRITWKSVRPDAAPATYSPASLTDVQCSGEPPQPLRWLALRLPSRLD